MHERISQGGMAGAAIATDRLSLQAPNLSDFPDMVALWSDPDVVRYIGGRVFSDEEIWQRLLRYRGEPGGRLGASPFHARQGLCQRGASCSVGVAG